MGCARNVIHHNIHASQLRPDLSEDTDMSAINHIGLEELEDGGVCVHPLEFDHIADLFQFLLDVRVVDVSITMEQREGALGFFPTAVLREPTRGAGKEHESQAQQRAGKHLKTPGNAEGRGALDEAAAIGNVEHDHDTPGDSIGGGRGQQRYRKFREIVPLTPTAGNRPDDLGFQGAQSQ